MARRNSRQYAPAEPYDAQRGGAAGSYPGIDPRMWASNGIVRSVSFDSDGAPLADVELLPSGDVVTARVACLYAGNGWGLYAGALAVDDEVAVMLPNADLSESPVIVGRLWSPADPAPPGAAAHPADVVLVVKPGTDLRVAVSGGGAVRLGGLSASEPLVLGTQLQNLLSSVLGALAAHVHPTGVGPSGPPSNAATYVTAKGQVDAGALNSEVAFTQKVPGA